MRLILAGFSIWAVGFLAIYALQATGCANGWPYLRAMMICVAALCIIAAVASVFASRRIDYGFLRQVATYTNIAATVALVLNFSTVAWMPLC